LQQSADSRRNVRARLPVHYAWIVTAITSLVMLASAGVRAAPSVLIKPLEADFGWSRSNISFAVAVSILWFGLGGPISGSLVDRYGPRRIMMIGLALIAAGIFGTLGINELWQFHLAWGMVVGIGTGALANVLGAAIALRWFRKHRGLVVGIFGAASAAGQLIFLPSLMSLTATSGWRTALTVAAAFVAALLVPLLLLMRDRPEDIGTRALGDDGAAASAASAGAELAQRTPLREALRTRDFWLLAGSFFVCGYTTNGLIGTHLLPHALEHGFTTDAAAGAVGMMGMMNIIGTLASGWLSDRYDNRVLLAAYYGFRALAIAQLPFIGDANANGLLFFALMYGLDWIATVPPTINLTATRFGRGSVGTLYGWIFFSHMVGASVAAYLGGYLHDMLGDYTAAFLSAALLGVIAAGFSISIQRGRRLETAPAA